MQSIFKKTLIAAALAATASANAATITGNGGADSVYTDKEYPLVSAEGLAIAESIDIGTAPGDISVELELESAYQETDLLIITIAGATIEDADSVAVGASPFEMLGVDAEAGTITLRPTQGSGGIAAGTYDLSGITLEAFSGVVTVASNGLTLQQIVIDKGDATPVAMAASEFSISAGSAKLGATIDVEKERKEFTGGTTDNFGVKVEAGADLLAVTPGAVELSVSGSNLDFLNDAEGELDAASYELDNVTEDDTKTTFEANTLSLTSSDAYSAMDNAFGVTFTADGVADDDAQALQAQSFWADVVLNYDAGGTNGSVAASGLAVGAWDLSGATVNMPYLPYGAGVSQVIYVSNDGSVSGDIELTAFDDEGAQFGPVTLSVQAQAGAVTRLAGAVYNALSDEGFNGVGKLDITLVINSPAADIDVYGAYNVRGDRVTVPVL